MEHILLYMYLTILTSVSMLTFREMGESEPLFESEDPVRTGEEEEESNRCTLWVEKYSPKNYTELLSDDVSHLPACSEGSR